MITFEENIDNICKEIKEVLIQKNSDYDNASLSTGDSLWNLVGNQVRIYDKVNRYKSLVKKEMKGDVPNYESMGDTILDIIGYGILGRMIYLEYIGKMKDDVS